MKKVVRVVMNSRKRYKSGVYRDHGRNCELTILPVGINPNPSRGFHISEEDFLNIMHNLPIELETKVENVLRFIKNDKQLESYEMVKEPVVLTEDQLKAAKELLKEKEEPKEPEAKVEVKIEVEPEVKKEENELLQRDWTVMDKEQLFNYRKELKSYANELDIKIAPALKNIEKIINKIKEGQNK